MPIRPRLIRSIPFWVLVLASSATIAGGAYLLNDKLGTMTSTLTAGTATGVDVYVGQSVAVLGAVLIGAGVLGVLLALAIAAASTLRPVNPPLAAQPAPAADDVAVDEPELDASADVVTERELADEREPVTPAR